MGGMLITNYDYSQLLIGNNRSKTATYTNGTGATVTLAKGALIGRIASSNKVTPAVATATDGSALPIGVLVDTYTVAAGASITVTFCYAGDIAKEQVVLDASYTWTTVIGTAAASVTLEDYVTAHTLIVMVPGTEHTKFDNQ